MIKTIATIVGARPQFIKAAPVSRALAGKLNEILIHTGQHYDNEMSDIFFEQMEIRTPDFNLGVGGGSHGEQTGRMLIELEKILATINPDCVMVYGDTNSTLAGALAAAKRQIPLVHVEAGLRSYNRAMPEEINRVLVDHVSDILFCPTERAVDNLNREGLTKGVYLVGDVMYDALLHDIELARRKAHILEQHDLKKGKYALATIHRASNTDERDHLRAILEAFSRLSSRIVFPVHPRTRKMLLSWNLSLSSNILLVEPVGRFDMLALLENADCVLTDSGGVQKEAYLVGVRCITLRDETEWVETVEVGWNKLVGVDPDLIQHQFETWYPASPRIPVYGQGDASEKMVDVLKKEFV